MIGVPINSFFKTFLTILISFEFDISNGKAHIGFARLETKVFVLKDVFLDEIVHP